MIEPVSDALTTVDEPGLQGEERDDQLGDVAERRVEDAADLRPGERAEPLGGEADDPGEAEDRRPPTTTKTGGAFDVQPEVERRSRRTDMASVTRTATRASGESAPRTGRRDAAAAACGHGANPSGAVRGQPLGVVERAARDPGRGGDPARGLARGRRRPRRAARPRRGAAARARRRRGRCRGAPPPRPPPRPTPTTSTNSPRAGIAPSAAAAASSPSVPADDLPRGAS